MPQVKATFLVVQRAWTLDPVNSPLGSLLEFLQDYFSVGLTPSAIKVFVLAISANHIPINGASLGRHPLVSRFLRGARHLRPFPQSRVPFWDLGRSGYGSI